jgi:hypothetical protein
MQQAQGEGEIYPGPLSPTSPLIVLTGVHMAGAHGWSHHSFPVPLLWGVYWGSISQLSVTISKYLR